MSTDDDNQNGSKPGRSAPSAHAGSEHRIVRWSFDHEAPDGALWNVDSARVDETLSGEFVAVVHLNTADLLADPAALLGVNAALTFDRVGHAHQFCGIVAEVSNAVQTQEDEVQRCSVRILPALALLELQTDTRIFQAMTIPQVVEEVLGDGLGKYGRELDTTGLNRSYPVREYIVQHQETDLHFVRRLLETEGICYRFQHPPVGQGALQPEKLELLDDTTTVEPDVSEDGEPLPIVTRPTDLGEHEALYALRRQFGMTPNKLTLRDYDWSRPQLGLQETKSIDAHDGVERHVYLPERSHRYEYGGNAYAADDQRDQVRLRFEGQVQDREVLSGASIVTGMRPGFAFETEAESAHPGKFLILEVHHASEGAAGADAGQKYHNTFTCIPLDKPFRPQRRHAKPLISGLQTALVVGEAAPNASQQKNFVDSHGRIKVQFQWDRIGQQTERSSSYLRCVMPWAGAGFGVAFIPRVGMEVAVGFVNGDPDKPIVTGCIHNGDNPFPLSPGEATQSLIRTHSESGSGFNEIRFEDKDGGERIFVHAQKDYDEVVENNHSTKVGEAQSNNVGTTQTISVGTDKSIKVGGNHAESVTGNYSTTISGAETRRVTGDQSNTILGSQTNAITGNQTNTTGGNQSETISGAVTQKIAASVTQGIGASLTQTIGATATETVTAAKAINVGGAFAVQVKGAMTCEAGAAWTATAKAAWSATSGASASISATDNTSIDAGKNVSVSGKSDVAVSAGKKLSVSAGDSIAVKGDKSATITVADEVTIKCGSATVTLKKNGDISINGGKIKVEGSGNVTIKGSKVSIN